MAIHKEQIKSALTQVVHPQYGKDLITLNLVQDLIIQEKYVSFTLELPRKDDRLSNQLIEESTRALKKFVDPDIVADITVGINISLQRELEGSPDQAQPQQAPPEPVLPGVKHVSRSHPEKEESVSLRWLQIWLSPWHRQVQKWACSIRISMGPVSLPCLVLQRGQTSQHERNWFLLRNMGCTWFPWAF